jgi:hypothetical protein
MRHTAGARATIKSSRGAPGAHVKTLWGENMKTILWATLALGLSITAQASVTSIAAQGRTAVFDSDSALTWTEFSTVTEGQAEGFRVATHQEFLALLTNAGLTYTPANTTASYPGLRPTLMSVASGTSLLDMSSAVTTVTLNTGGLPVGGIPGLVEPAPVLRQDAGLVASTMGDEPYVLAALSEKTSTLMCDTFTASGTTSVPCGTSVTTRGLTDGLREFGSQAATPDSVLYGYYIGELGFSVANNDAKVNPAHLGYYMVKAVPEPSTWALMGLGLCGLAAARRRQSAAA